MIHIKHSTIPNFYSPSECHYMIKSITEWLNATVATQDGEVHSQHRKAEIAKAEPLRAGEIFEHIQDYNYSNYNLHLNTKYKCTINKYEEGQGFGRHQDIVVNETSLKATEARKISCAIQLNTEYEGGELIIGKTTASKGLGDLHIFHSITPHEVAKVTRGTRYSLNIFAYGEIKF